MSRAVEARKAQRMSESHQAIARALNTIALELFKVQQWTPATERALLEVCRAIPGVTRLEPEGGGLPVYSDSLYIVLGEEHDTRSKR
jgi:hypothetical protein